MLILLNVCLHVVTHHSLVHRNNIGALQFCERKALNIAPLECGLDQDFGVTLRSRFRCKFLLCASRKIDHSFARNIIPVFEPERTDRNLYIDRFTRRWNAFTISSAAVAPNAATFLLLSRFSAAPSVLNRKQPHVHSRRLIFLDPTTACSKLQDRWTNTLRFLPCLRLFA